MHGLRQGCLLGDKQKGTCGKYILKKGQIRETSPHRYLTVCPISIETMPILHFYPQAKLLQITTTGCNFNCGGCVSTSFVRELDEESPALRNHTPQEIIEKAIREECLGITFMMNDPLASYFTFLEVAKEAKTSGLLVGCSTNGYFTGESAERIAPYLDFANIGMKGFDDADYRPCGAASVTPVLDTIRLFHQKGVHLELSCMYKNGSEEDLLGLAKWTAGIDKTIPLQIMRYMPLEKADKKEEPGIASAEQFCHELESILDYVYLFNSPGTDQLNTYCPECRSLLIQRNFYGPMGAKVKQQFIKRNLFCPHCGEKSQITHAAERKDFREEGFLGGYPFTRALEIVESILIAIGITEKSLVVRIWEYLLRNNGLASLHQETNSIPDFIGAVRKFGDLGGKDENAEKLARYLEDKVQEIASKTTEISEKPRVLYTMGKPCFALNAGRFENALVRAAGGISVNDKLDINGRPGENISPEFISSLNPDIIFVSAFFSNSAEELYQECLKAGINCRAVTEKAIYEHPYPNIDFGSPRWILGLMNIADILYPDLFSYNIYEEAVSFYKTFYHCDFHPEELNLSFAKPNRVWEWDTKSIHAAEA